jgi:NAD(P)-dependent dehydrogenase (short-subunit alcohol dehydrogenase family)
MSEQTSPPFSVKGKRALITGAGSGINFCFATLLLSKGCSVLIADLTLRPEAQKLINDHSSTSPRAVFHQTDVTDWPQLESAFHACIKEFGGIDIACPGAGVFEPPWSNFWFPPGDPMSKDTKEGNSYKTLDINLNHPIRATQIAISHFLNPVDAKDKASLQNPKRVVLTSSIAGQVAGLQVPLYFVSKHGVSAFCRSMGGLDNTLGIRVNAVAPGVVRTPLFTENPHKMQWVNEETDVWITPEEIAEQMLRLLEDEELVGGTILEVGKGHNRIVPMFNNPGPQGEGMGSSNSQVAVEEALGNLGRQGWGLSS